jgi:hypothetical protein
VVASHKSGPTPGGGLAPSWTVNLFNTAAASPGQRVIVDQSVTVSAALTRPDRRSNDGQTILKD